VTDRFGSQSGEHPFAVLGDLNDYLEDDDQGSIRDRRAGRLGPA